MDRLSTALTDLLLASLGIILASTWAFPEVTCSEDICLIGRNVFAIPAILMGAVLGIASVVVFSAQKIRTPPAAKN